MFSKQRNGLEESHLRNPNGSRHYNGWREAFSATVVFWIGGVVLTSLLGYSPISSKFLFFTLFFTGIGFGLLFRWALFLRPAKKLA